MIIIIKATKSKSETVLTQIRIGSSLPQPENSVGDQSYLPPPPGAGRGAPGPIRPAWLRGSATRKGLTGIPRRGRTVPRQKRRNLGPEASSVESRPPTPRPTRWQGTKTPSPGARALHPEPGLRGGSKGLGFGDQVNLSCQPTSPWPCRVGQHYRYSS